VYSSSIFFVVGNQSPNKYGFFGPASASSGTDSDPVNNTMGEFLRVLPSSWDSLLIGMGRNEVRVIGMPPCYYRSKALSKEFERYQLQEDKKMDDDDAHSYLQLTVKCLSINGEA